MTMVDEAPKRQVGRPKGSGLGNYRPNRKRAAFIKAVADGMDPAEAVVAAGYKTATPGRMALRLMHIAAVRAAIEDAGSAKVTLLQQLEEARQFAVTHKDAGAVVESIRLRCVLLGLLK
jgi:hypothetical protein